MVFDAEYDADGKLALAITYACLGKGKFSFNILSRTKQWTSTDILARAAKASDAAHGLLDTDGLRVSDEAAYDKCGFHGGNNAPHA